MMRVRKLLAAGAAVCLIGLLSACGQEQNAAQIPTETDPLSAPAEPGSGPEGMALPEHHLNVLMRYRLIIP